MAKVSKHLGHAKELFRSGETKDGRFMTVINCLTCNERECVYSNNTFESAPMKDNLDSRFKMSFADMMEEGRKKWR